MGNPIGISMGIGMGTVMNANESVGILNTCEIKRKSVKHAIKVD